MRTWRTSRGPCRHRSRGLSGRRSRSRSPGRASAWKIGLGPATASPPASGALRRGSAGRPPGCASRSRSPGLRPRARRHATRSPTWRPEAVLGRPAPRGPSAHARRPLQVWPAAAARRAPRRCGPRRGRDSPGPRPDGRGRRRAGRTARRWRVRREAMDGPRGGDGDLIAAVLDRPGPGAGPGVGGADARGARNNRGDRRVPDPISSPADRRDPCHSWRFPPSGQYRPWEDGPARRPTRVRS